ncbi:DExH-box ATP-dependent RNA helicase DExH14-like [Actinidia eriantha]|uniref:DExH-box ATP-dependent RNA helicase DExH14-like n=1 Tax=Actinidia eriantha TaxID=165200 RepID=UPI0025864133|nr:DExH-box ATP-dependent RNA helicase DExH14-like [Actinidia eriantha]
MLLQIPRLTPSTSILIISNAKSSSKTTILAVNAANSLEESVLVKKIVYRWDEASLEVRQAYNQFGESRRIGQGSVTGDLSKPVPKLMRRIRSKSLSLQRRLFTDRMKCGKRTTGLEIEPEN